MTQNLKSFNEIQPSQIHEVKETQQMLSNWEKAKLEYKSLQKININSNSFAKDFVDKIKQFVKIDCIEEYQEINFANYVKLIRQLHKLKEFFPPINDELMKLYQTLFSKL